MSLGLVVLEKSLTCTRTPTPQSDDIKKHHVSGSCSFGEEVVPGDAGAGAYATE